MLARTLMPILLVLVVLAALVRTGAREERHAPRPSPRTVPTAPSTPVSGTPTDAPLFREIGSSGPVVMRTGDRVDMSLGPDEERIGREAREGLAKLDAFLRENGLAAILGALGEAAVADDGPRFGRMEMGLQWKIADGSPDWGLVEGFALDPSRPLVARKAAVLALANAKGPAVRSLVMAWFGDPRFHELRPTLLEAVTQTDYEAEQDVRWRAEELLRGQVRNAEFPGPAMEASTLQAPRSREVLDLTLEVARTEKATECARLAIASLSGLLYDAQCWRDREEGAAFFDPLLDAVTTTRIEAVLLEASSDSGRGSAERAIALRAFEHLPPDAARSSRVMACLAGVLRSDADAGMRYVAVEQLRALWPQSRELLEEARRDPDALVRELARAPIATQAGGD